MRRTGLLRLRDARALAKPSEDACREDVDRLVAESAVGREAERLHQVVVQREREDGEHERAGVAFDEPALTLALQDELRQELLERLEVPFAVFHGEAVGFATISFAPFAWTGSDIAFLQDLFVGEAARGQGAGEVLLKAVYAEADAQGATQVFWMVDETDEKLQRFYARNAIRTPYLRYMREPWPW